MVIKTLDISNPFADYGNIVEGGRFIGRKYAIEAIKNRVLGNSYGNLAIMGLPRIGKSSLVWNSLMANKIKLAERKILVERINVGSIESPKEFYIRLIDKALLNVELLDKSLHKLLSKAKKDFIKTENETELEYFFSLIKINGFRIIYILDEFDSITNFFTFSDFQLLRELSISPDTKICLVTISRQSIEELEIKSFGGSTFHQVFTYYHLGTYSETDIEEYWRWVESLSIKISIDYKTKVEYLVGKHPFLMDMFNFNVFNTLKNKPKETYQTIIDNTESELRLTLYQSFETAFNLLKEENLYTKAFQLVLGPIFDVNSIDEQKLIKYQFIKEVSLEEKEKLIGGSIGLKTLKNTSYICFSDYCTLFWKLKMYETDFWSLWKDTESNIRDIIKTYIEETFGTENWEEKYFLKNPSETRKELIGKLQKERDKYQKNFGSLASSHIVDYTYPMDMYDLFISTDWIWFAKIFNTNDKKHWAKIFNELAFLRNPVAHNNTEFVPISRINEAKAYCELILEKIEDWRKSTSK